MKLRITLVKSPIGYDRKKQRATLKALGLKKLNSTVIKEDIPQIRGMINVVSHLVRVEKVDE
ncbi:MAG: large subunit ribosomal protein [Thermotogota bacterium]|nr:large subunit ribosomal protein [Thermotogota bacterium]MDK2864142.1 large subunit ribosomal protein [Thermotogota bacterium]HCZ06884.1 50S ribosomal protein L30 [Thermotogota bacterium]